MTREFAVSASQMVARSLKISRATHMTVAAVAAAVAINAAVAVQFLSLAGQLVLFVVLFVSLAAGLSAISTDIYSRSSQVVANLRSIGATSGAISSAVAVSMLVYGAAGAALGAAVGAGLGSVFGSQGAPATTLAVDVLAVIIASSGAVAAGVYVGARTSWHS